jgi:hypothetical protein
MLQTCVLIPGRVPAYKGTGYGVWADQVHQYFNQTTDAFLYIKATCYYGYQGSIDINPQAVAELHIPHPFGALEAIGVVLLGSLYSKRAQVQQLELNRIILPASELIARLGPECARGALEVCYGQA